MYFIVQNRKIKTIQIFNRYTYVCSNRIFLIKNACTTILTHLDSYLSSTFYIWDKCKSWRERSSSFSIEGSSCGTFVLESMYKMKENTIFLRKCNDWQIQNINTLGVSLKTMKKLIGSVALLWRNAKVLALLKVKCEIH